MVYFVSAVVFNDEKQPRVSLDARRPRVRSVSVLVDPGWCFFVCVVFPHREKEACMFNTMLTCCTVPGTTFVMLATLARAVAAPRVRRTHSLA